MKMLMEDDDDQENSRRLSDKSLKSKKFSAFSVDSLLSKISTENSRREERLNNNVDRTTKLVVDRSELRNERFCALFREESNFKESSLTNHEDEADEENELSGEETGKFDVLKFI